MEAVESVDVSWLHHSHRDNLSRTKSASSTVVEKPNGHAETSPQQQSRGKPQQSAGGNGLTSASEQSITGSSSTKTRSENAPPDTNSGTGNDKAGEQKASITSNAAPKGSAPRPIPTNRRNSWISSLSSKFSSGSTPPSQNNFKDGSPNFKQSPPANKLDQYNPFGASFSPKDKENDPLNPFTSSSPKNPSFFQNALRRLSSGNAGIGKVSNNGTVCQRRVMNVNPNRDRCRVPELDQAKLKRVAFCVDVEIAGISPREDDEDTNNGQRDANHKTQSSKNSEKSKGKGEGSALKNETLQDAGKDPKQTASVNGEGKTEGPVKELTRKQEKKKRSEEERKERKERKRRQAEANGTVPLQLRMDDDDNSRAPTPGSSQPRTQNHPTTDPVRIYRRCCQLRETPVLKKLVDRMTSQSSTLVEAPGTVAVLDLTDYPMTLQDIITFSDWLAIVPVRKLILENCALTDEGVRSILAGLLSTKTMEQARNHRRAARKNHSPVVKEDGFGVVERLSLKNNPKIGPEGWRHISLFVHLSKSIKAIDLSGIPFPKAPVATNGPAVRSSKPVIDIASTLASALRDRFGGNRLEELLLSECNPSTEDVAKICDAAISFGLRRFGLANNNLTREGLEHVVRYFRAGTCEGLDLGGNNLKDHLDVLIPAIDSNNPIMTLSLADCSLTPAAIFPLLQAFPRLPNLRFIDLSHNPDLFSSQPDALSMLRRFLPKMPFLKRIHLADVNLSPDHAIALAEVLPECPSLCHLNILENPKIVSLTSATDPASQEEACAVYASLMAAVRVSRTIIAVDIEVPSAESSEVVKALASQIVAYCLRNLGAIEELNGSDDASAPRPQVPVPEVLQHIVGHVDGTLCDAADVEPAPDEDYVIGGTGVVKALGVCLGNVDHYHPELGDLSRPSSRPSSRPTSGRSTPVPRVTSSISKTKKPRDMSKNLLDSARNIRARIQSALVREDRAGNDNNYRRLQFLDVTLQKIIQRFEDEYPETRIEPLTTSMARGEQDQSGMAGSLPADTVVDGETAIDDEDTDQYAVRLSRSGSNTSLHSRALTSEEGHIHRIGQNLRRDFLNPSLGSSANGLSTIPDESRLAALREKLENLRGDEIRSRVESVGPDKALEELGSTVEELWIIQRQDKEAFQKFKESQIAAQINGGLRPPLTNNSLQSEEGVSEEPPAEEATS
ncbi:hypothetical protein VTN77DRAFT_9584 [Rasamsonia byssochlamydoides]|uniref:uncharacterized protein n=1 Tax=Rasamsonia byssochlamydoides TaxID=89139 RepID=UPI003743A113